MKQEALKAIQQIEKNILYVQTIPEQIIIDNPEIVELILAKNPLFFPLIPQKARLRHENLCIKYLETNIMLISFMSETTLLANIDLLTNLVSNNPLAITLIPHQIYDMHPKIAVAALLEDGFYIRRINIETQLSHPQIPLAAVQSNTIYQMYIPFKVQNSLSSLINLGTVSKREFIKNLNLLKSPQAIIDAAITVIMKIVTFRETSQLFFQQPIGSSRKNYFTRMPSSILERIKSFLITKKNKDFLLHNPRLGCSKLSSSQLINYHKIALSQHLNQHDTHAIILNYLNFN